MHLNLPFPVAVVLAAAITYLFYFGLAWGSKELGLRLKFARLRAGDQISVKQMPGKRYTVVRTESTGRFSGRDRIIVKVGKDGEEMFWRHSVSKIFWRLRPANVRTS